MNKKKLALLGCLVGLIAYVILPVVPAMASNSVTISGTVPLVIFDEQASEITDHTAIISWNTNCPASSQVNSEVIWKDMVNNISEKTMLNDTNFVLLTGLSSATTYCFTVQSTADVGSTEFQATSTEYAFVTKSSSRTMTNKIPISSPLRSNSSQSMNFGTVVISFFRSVHNLNEW